MSDSLLCLPLTRHGQPYLCQVCYGFFRNGMPCYLVEMFDARHTLLAVVQVHPRDAETPHRPEELDALLQRVCISNWLLAFDQLMVLAERGEAVLPAWFNLGFEQL